MREIKKDEWIIVDGVNVTIDALEGKSYNQALEDLTQTLIHCSKLGRMGFQSVLEEIETLKK